MRSSGHAHEMFFERHVVNVCFLFWASLECSEEYSYQIWLSFKPRKRGKKRIQLLKQEIKCSRASKLILPSKIFLVIIFLSIFNLLRIVFSL